jgi:hypothetical protein
LNLKCDFLSSLLPLRLLPLRLFPLRLLRLRLLLLSSSSPGFKVCFHTFDLYRYSPDMPQLRSAFEKEVGNSLQSVIKKECAGDFEKALVSLAAYTPPTGIKARLDAGEVGNCTSCESS